MNERYFVAHARLELLEVSLAQLVEAVRDARVALDGVGGHRQRLLMMLAGTASPSISPTSSSSLASFDSMYAASVACYVWSPGEIPSVSRRLPPPPACASASDSATLDSAVSVLLSAEPAAALLVAHLPRRVLALAAAAAGASSGTGARRRERLADGLINARRQRREFDTPAVQKRRLALQHTPQHLRHVLAVVTQTYAGSPSGPTATHASNQSPLSVAQSTRRMQNAEEDRRRTI